MGFHVPEQYRLMQGDSAKLVGENYGIFIIPYSKERIRVIASAGAGWDHVSVSLENRTPTWEEMCFIKGLFWDDEDCVVQFHPPKSQWINNHPYCLHLWRVQWGAFPQPSPILVGLPGTESLK
jgi:hypothetical protein